MLVLDIILLLVLVGLGALTLTLYMRVRRFAREVASMPVLSDQLATVMTGCKQTLDSMVRTAGSNGQLLVQQGDRAQQTIQELSFLISRAEKMLDALEKAAPASALAAAVQSANPSPLEDLVHEAAVMPGRQHGQVMPTTTARSAAHAAAAHMQQPMAQQSQQNGNAQSFLSADEHRLPYSTPNRPVGNALRRIAKPLPSESADEAVVMPGRLQGVNAQATPRLEPQKPAPQKPVAMRTSVAAYATSSTRNTMSTEAEMELRRALEESL